MTAVQFVRCDDSCSVCLLAVMTAVQLSVLQALMNSQTNEQKQKDTNSCTVAHPHCVEWLLYVERYRYLSARTAVTSTGWPKVKSAL
jgi:hypothetical protein